MDKATQQVDREARLQRALERKTRIVAHRANNFEEAEQWDLAYWQAMTPQERLSAQIDIHKNIAKVEQARQDYEQNR